MIAVLIAIESTRGTLISATLAVGEKSCRRAFSSARASRSHSQLLLWNVSTTNATEYFVAISEVSGVPCSPPRAHGGLPARMRQSRPTLKKIPTYDAAIFLGLDTFGTPGHACFALPEQPPCAPCFARTDSNSISRWTCRTNARRTLTKSL